jgi:hypothetical protein
MARRINTSQLQSKIRQTQQRQRHAITKFVNDYNREARRVNAHNQRIVDNYNREVRAYNARVRRNRQKLQYARAQLRANPTTMTVHYATQVRSVRTLQQSFTRLEREADHDVWVDEDLFDLAESETANSVSALNALLTEPSEVEQDDPALQQTAITTELYDINPDLDNRWRGALFARSPRNPDAARHFCTSCREIMAYILDLKAPDQDVLAYNPHATRTPNNQVTRREKIQFCLAQQGQQNAALVAFVERDIDDVLDLFKVFNPATHGAAGRYDLAQLGALKLRVEGAIQFLHRIVSW